MNFCEKSDLYVSLYIDEQLERKEKVEFEKHMKKCTQCAQKLKEESYFVQLCKNDEEVILPEGFSASLHSRLMEISREEHNKTNETFDKKKPFYLNRKLMASISTAAVILLSLLAYSILPKMGSGMNMATTANDRAEIQVTESQEMKDAADSSEAAATDNNNSADINSVLSDSSAEKTAGVSDDGSQMTAKSKENIPADTAKFNSKKSSEQVVGYKNFKVKAASGQPAEDSIKYGAAANPDEASDDSENENAMADTQRVMGLAIPEEDTGNNQYFTNYVEMTLTIESGEADMESLNKLMAEYGASVQSSGMVQGYSANLKDDTAYVEYAISMNDYVPMQTEARLKYNLELTAKTDIIKKDITEEHNILETKTKELENKINESLNKGEDITTLETEKSSLIEQINVLIARQEMITIRIFLVGK